MSRVDKFRVCTWSMEHVASSISMLYITFSRENMQIICIVSHMYVPLLEVVWMIEIIFVCTYLIKDIKTAAGLVELSHAIGQGCRETLAIGVNTDRQQVKMLEIGRSGDICLYLMRSTCKVKIVIKNKENFYQNKKISKN